MYLLTYLLTYELMLSLTRALENDQLSAWRGIKLKNSNAAT